MQKWNGIWRVAKCYMMSYTRLSASVFFNRGSAKPQGSATGCPGCRRNRLKLPGTKSPAAVLPGCSNIDTWIIV